MSDNHRGCFHRNETSSVTAAAAPTSPMSLSLSRDAEARPKQVKGENKRMSVAEYVEARFAAFDRAYGLTALDACLAGNDNDSTQKKNGNASNSNGNNKQSSLTKKQTSALKARNEESESDEDEDACVTLTYFALLTSLYLPLLLFLWIRRSVFGAGSLIRSLFLGHILRLILAFLLLPPSTTKSLVPTWAWNAGVSTATRAENLWNDKRVQGMIPGWLHLLLAIILGTNEGGNHASLGSSSTYDFPPALTLLAIFTISVFVVHPDGLTWIMLGRMRDGIRSTLQKAALVIVNLKDGTIILTPSEISGTIAGFFIVYTIIRSIIFPKKRKKCATPTQQREKTTRNKHKKGKKGRGRNHHNNSNGGRGRIRGGHYRSKSELYESSNRTTSSSPSPSNRHRCDSDMEATTVSAISEVNVTSFEGCKKDIYQKLKAETTESSLPLESRVEDENSCASSLATNHSNSLSIQEGGKHGNRKGHAKNWRKNTSNDVSISHQTDRKEKKIGGPEGGSSQTRRNKPNASFVRGEVSGDIRQTHPSSQPDSRSKKKTRHQRSKKKVSNKFPKSDSDFQGYSSTSFFSSTVSSESALHQHSHHLDEQRTINAPQSTPLEGVQNVLADGVLGNNVDVSSPKQSVQRQDTNSTTLFELASSEEGHISVNPHDSPIGQYEETRNHYEVTSHRYESTNNQHKTTRNQYESTSNQYEAIRNQHEAARHQYEAARHQFEAASNQYEATYQQYEAASNQYEATNNRHGMANLPYDVSEAPPTLYECAGAQHETAVNTQVDPISNYNVRSCEHVHSYFNNQSQYSAGKQELLAFFAEVQLTGSACEAILRNVEDVDALKSLTDTDFLAYGVEPKKCTEIKALFEARRRRQMFDSTPMQQNLMPWSTGIAPPPGLVPNLDSAVTASEALSNHTYWKECDQQQNTRSSYSPLPSSPSSSGCLLSSSRSPNLPQCNVENHVVNTAVTPPCTAPYEYKLPIIPSISNSAALSNGHGQKTFTNAFNNDAKIEADLQELGGQMAGSILDF